MAVASAGPKKVSLLARTTASEFRQVAESAGRFDQALAMGTRTAFGSP